jgi:hypothetical protein
MMYGTVQCELRGIIVVSSDKGLVRSTNFLARLDLTFGQEGACLGVSASLAHEKRFEEHLFGQELPQILPTLRALLKSL